MSRTKRSPGGRASLPACSPAHRWPRCPPKLPTRHRPVHHQDRGTIHPARRVAGGRMFRHQLHPGSCGGCFVAAGGGDCNQIAITNRARNAGVFIRYFAKVASTRPRVRDPRSVGRLNASARRRAADVAGSANRSGWSPRRIRSMPIAQQAQARPHLRLPPERSNRRAATVMSGAVAAPVRRCWRVCLAGGVRSLTQTVAPDPKARTARPRVPLAREACHPGLRLPAAAIRANAFPR